MPSGLRVQISPHVPNNAGMMSIGSMVSFQVTRLGSNPCTRSKQCSLSSEGRASEYESEGRRFDPYSERQTTRNVG